MYLCDAAPGPGQMVYLHHLSHMLSYCVIQGNEYIYVAMP